jgi:proteasome lid subunit RPN8/RPN11
MKCDSGKAISWCVLHVALASSTTRNTRFSHWHTAEQPRPEMVVGWYHSHPGFGCWLSGVDINTQQVRLPSRHVPDARNVALVDCW